MTTKHAVLFAMLVAMLTFACQERVPIGEGEQLPAEQDAGTPMVCDPGRQIECACLGGYKGVQVCSYDGSRYEACQCPQPEAGTDAGCKPTLVLAEEEVDSHEVLPGTTSVFLPFTASIECATPECCTNVDIGFLSFYINSLDGDFVEPNSTFSNIRIIAEDLSVEAGPVNDLQFSTATSAQVGLHGAIHVLAYAKARSLRLMMDVASADQLPATALGHRFEVMIAGVGGFVGQNEDFDIQAFPGDNSIKIVAPSNFAAYCEPWASDPQVFGYHGCCGTFTKTNQIKAGNLFKSESYASVYYLGSDGKRYLFPSTIELDSWYAPLDALSVPMHDYDANCLSVLEITDVQMAGITIGGHVTKRPGAYITGFAIDPKRYVVDTHHVLHWASSQILDQIYPGTVQVRTFMTPDAFFGDYTGGMDLTSADDFIWLQKYPSADIEVELGIKP